MKDFTTAEVETMVERYNNGEGLRPIAKDFNSSVTTVRERLKLEGVSIRGRGRPAKSNGHVAAVTKAVEEEEELKEELASSGLPTFEVNSEW